LRLEVLSPSRFLLPTWRATAGLAPADRLQREMR